MHSFSHNLFPGPSAKFGTPTENVIPIKNFVMLMIYIYPYYATLKRMPLFNFPLIWNAVGVEKNKPRHSVADPDPNPDPHVFGPLDSGSGSTSERYGSGSGSCSGSGS